MYFSLCGKMMHTRKNQKETNDGEQLKVPERMSWEENAKREKKHILLEKKRTSLKGKKNGF